MYLLMATTVAAIAQAHVLGDPVELFSQFVVEHQRTFKAGSEEYNYRLKVFTENLDEIKKAQELSPTSAHGITRFADLTRDEFRRMYTGYKPITAEDVQNVCLSGSVPPVLKTREIPPAFDWRTQQPGVVTPVKDQGGCGSCWTFSAIGNIEGQYVLQGNPSTAFSEQSLVDCSHGCITHMGNRVCNQGCGGGWQFVAFADMATLGGVPTEAAYPYHGTDGTCKTFTPVARVTNYTCITPMDGSGADEADMAAYLVQHGPLAMAMDVSAISSYISGVYNPSSCSKTALDHALLIVGYGTVNGLDYWTIKNSWGASWGEKGYFRLLRGSNKCGVANAVSSAILA